MHIYGNPSYENLIAIIKVLEANYTGLVYTDDQGTEYVITGACTASFDNTRYVSFIFSNIEYPNIIHTKPVKEFLNVYRSVDDEGDKL